MIEIGKNYENYKLNKNALYYVNYKLLKKSNEYSWNKLFSEQIYDEIDDFDLIENNMVVDKEEEDFITKNNSEFN